MIANTPWITPGTVHRVSECAGVILAPNPNAMTLDGTNSWVLSAPVHPPQKPGFGDHPASRGKDQWPGPDVVIVDPGPADEGHLQALAATGNVVLILVTHRHADHTAGIDRLHELTGAPVRAVLPEFCRDHGEPLQDGDHILAAGVRIHVLATPGHTSDSVSFHLPHDEPESMITGDTILGRGTTMIDHPDGSLGDYLRSLELLSQHCGVTVLPAHAAPLHDLQDACEELSQHRLARLKEIQEVLDRLGREATLEAITDEVYADVPQGVRPAAELSVAAQLAYLGFSGSA